MNDPQSRNAPRRRVGIYERLRQPGTSPAKMVGMGVVILAIIIVLIIVLTRYV
jgi:hypothetical protein